MSLRAMPGRLLFLGFGAPIRPHTKALKKALMQDLLTGKVRVKVAE